MNNMFWSSANSAYRQGILTVLFALVLLTVSSPTLAQQEEAHLPGGEEVPQEVLSPGEQEEDSLQQRHERWSEMITSTASYMDQFFDNEQHSTTSNKTYLRLRLTPRYNNDGFSLDNYVDVRLQLPNTERWLLTFGGDPDDESRYGSTPLEKDETEKSGRDKANAYAGVTTFLKQKRTRNISTGVGVRFRGIKPVPYGSAKWVEVWEYDKFDLRLSERARYYVDTGPELKSQLDFDWPIAHKFFARASGSFTLEKDQNKKNFDIQYSLYQYLTTRRALLYEITTGYATSRDRSTHLDTVNYEFQYRQQWRDWFYTTLVGQVKQDDANDWKASPGIRLDFNIIIGHTQKHTFNSQYDNKQERLRKREWEKLDKRMRELNKDEKE